MRPRTLVVLSIVSLGCSQQQATDETEVWNPQLKRPISSLLDDVPKDLTPITNPPSTDSQVLKMADPIRTVTDLLRKKRVGTFGTIEDARTRILKVEPPKNETGLHKACVQLVEMTRNRSTRIGDDTREDQNQRLSSRLAEVRTALGLKDDDSADEPLMLVTHMLVRSSLKLQPDKNTLRLSKSKALLQRMSPTDSRVQRLNRLVQQVEQVAETKSQYSESTLTELIAIQKELRLDRYRYQQLWRDYGSQYPLDVTPRPPGHYGPPSRPDRFKL